jgi:hypothetical protein
LTGQSNAVRAAASRVLAQAEHDNEPGVSSSATLDLTNNPSLVRGFDSLGRGDDEAAVSLSYDSPDLAGRLSIGGFTQTFRGHDTKLMLDGSYVAAKVGDEALLYAGWLDHWWVARLADPKADAFIVRDATGVAIAFAEAAIRQMLVLTLHCCFVHRGDRPALVIDTPHSVAFCFVADRRPSDIISEC